MTSTATPKFVRSVDESGEIIEDSYDVVVDGAVVGRVRRGSASAGYYGSWTAGRRGFSSRREAAESLIAR
jgi:hypothetical protein